MKLLFLLTALSTLLVLSSCSTISKEDCGKDMKQFGHDLGKRGQANLLEDIRKSCKKAHPEIDLAAYQSGFEQGWSEYCTPFNGYRSGVKGDLYTSYCPADKEDLYREKFLIGKKVYEKKDQVRELQEKIMDLSDDGKELTNPSSHDERTKLKIELRDLNNEIQGLEQKGMSLIHTN